MFRKIGLLIPGIAMLASVTPAIAAEPENEAAEAAAAEFHRVHGGGGSGGPQAGLAVPDDVPEVSLPADATTDGMISPVELIRLCGFASSNSEGRRLVAERGVRLNGEVVTDALEPMAVSDGDVFQRGKRKFARLRLA